jgi:hypothetical protein
MGSLSTEHVVPKWVRKALQIREPIKEFSGTAYVGAAETLAIVFHEVCVSCNKRWMESLEGPRALWVPKTCATWADASSGRRRLSPVSGAWLPGPGLAGHAMIFGLWA